MNIFTTFHDCGNPVNISGYENAIKPKLNHSHLVVVDELLKFISMNDNMQSTHLSQTKLLPFNTGKANLQADNIFDTNVNRTYRGKTHGIKAIHINTTR